MRKKPKGGASFEVSGIFADPEVGRVLYSKGLIADANKSSIEELATITSFDNHFYGNKVITQFPELQYCTGLTNLDMAFGECSNLTTVGDIIPEGVTSVYYAFGECTSLTKAPVIPSSATDAGYAFYNCSNTDGIYIIKATRQLTYNSALDGANVQAVYFPDGLADAYKRSSGWNKFSSKIYPMSQYPK